MGLEICAPQDTPLETSTPAQAIAAKRPFIAGSLNSKLMDRLKIDCQVDVESMRWRVGELQRSPQIGHGSSRHPASDIGATARDRGCGQAGAALQQVCRHEAAFSSSQRPRLSVVLAKVEDADRVVVRQ